MRLKLTVAAIAVSSFAGSALAADLPNLKEPPAFPPVFTWTGLYVGAQAGYQWGTSTRESYNDLGTYLGADPTLDENGPIGGVHLGYNYQAGFFVLGFEADVEGSGYTGTGLNTAGTITSVSHEPVEASFRGRAGLAFDRFLIYATGGEAFAANNSTATNLTTGATDSSSGTLAGWTAGGGVEYAIDNNWSVSAEYRYTDFSAISRTLTYTTATAHDGPDTTVSHPTDNRVEVGVSYKFDWFAPPPPVAAKY